VREIGNRGSIVDRRTGRSFAMGSSFPREAWIWAWERGLTDKARRFVVEECSDPVAFRNALSHVYAFEGEKWKNPITNALPWDWRAIGVFYDMRDSVRVRAGDE
jgi:hypothetical protein